MKKILLSSCCIAAFALLTFAQQPVPTPVEKVEEDDAVVKISTALIQIDVTVLDKDGNLVTDLTADDFELFENGEKQQISNFSLMTRTAGGATFGDSRAPAATGNAAVAAARNPVKRGDIRRTLAFVVDDLNMSFASVYYTRKSLKKFVDEQMQADDLVAIIRTGGSTGTLQQFTSDKRLLHAAIDKIRWNALGGSVNALTSVGQNDTDISDRFTRESSLIAGGNSKSTTILLPREISPGGLKEERTARSTSSQEAGIHAQTSLGSIRYILTGMKKLPGRKAMMLFSDGISLGDEGGKGRGSSVLGYLQGVADEANRSSVVVYTFDTRGLKSMAINASDSTYEVIDGHRDLKERERTKDFKESQDGLVYFAAQTGGKSLLNSDNFNGGIQRALNEQSTYYLLGYVPDTDTFDPNKRKFNKFEVKVKRPGLKVSYRSGFFSNNPDDDSAAPQITAQRQMAEALMSPFAQNDITVNLNALYADDPADGAYVRSLLHIDAKSLSFSDAAEGWKTAAFDVVAVMFDENGVPVETKDAKYTIKTRGATYDTLMEKGFVYALMVPAAKPGVYQYRVALRDSASGKIGSVSQIVEIPNLAKQRLTVSSLAVEDVSTAAWESITQGKTGNKPGQVQLPSTLLYDTVLKQFQAGTVLRYGYEVYNARANGSGPPRIETQAKVLQNDRVVVQGNVNKLDAAAQTDHRHLKVSGAILLNNNLTPGDYMLQVIVTDTVSKQTSTQLFPFEVVK